MRKSAPKLFKDEKLPPPERASLQERYAARAVDSLRQAVAEGYGVLTELKKDPDLEAVRGRADFQKVVQELDEKMKKP